MRSVMYPTLDIAAILPLATVHSEDPLMPQPSLSTELTPQAMASSTQSTVTIVFQTTTDISHQFLPLMLVLSLRLLDTSAITSDPSMLTLWFTSMAIMILILLQPTPPSIELMRATFLTTVSSHTSQ